LWEKVARPKAVTDEGEWWAGILRRPLTRLERFAFDPPSPTRGLLQNTALGKRGYPAPTMTVVLMGEDGVAGELKRFPRNADAIIP
jgi:hypothetical protein